MHAIPSRPTTFARLAHLSINEYEREAEPQAQAERVINRARRRLVSDQASAFTAARLLQRH